MKKLIVLSLVAMLAVPMTVHAEEDRIAALEEKVAALEQRVAALEGGSAPAGVSEAPAQEAVAPPAVDTGIEYKGCTLEYVDYSVFTDKDNNPRVILYFDYFNGSGETKRYSTSFEITVFQHGKELKTASAQGDEAYDEMYTEMRSGSDPLRVASCFQLTDMSDIIVSMDGFVAFDSEPVEFTLSLE